MGWLRTLQEARGSPGPLPWWRSKGGWAVACLPGPRRLANQSTLGWRGRRRPSCLPPEAPGSPVGTRSEVRDPSEVEAMLMAQAPLQDAHMTFRRPLQASLLVCVAASSCAFIFFFPFCFLHGFVSSPVAFLLPLYSFLCVYFLCRLPLAPRMGWHLVYCLSLFLPLLPALFVPTLLRWS